MNTTLYEVSSFFSLIVNKPSFWAGILRIVGKGTKIEVISLSGIWAYFKYNGEDAYIRLSTLKIVTTPPIVTGSIAIKYIDETTLSEISTATTLSNLTLGSYTYNSIAIVGYFLLGSSSQSITLTDTNPNQTITFKYKKILGTVEIHYIHVSTKKELLPVDFYTNLDLKSYTYTPKAISDYIPFGADSKSVLLTETSPIQVIEFEYKLVTLPLDPSNQNEVPYISTYYIKPIIAPNEEVIIDFYITDYYHKEYVNEDFSENFTVTIKIDGIQDILIPDIQAGDHSINIGSFTAIGEQKFSILCTDQYGRNSHELFNFFLVKDEVIINEYVMTTDDLAYYKIDNTNSPDTVTDTREGLQKLFDDKKVQGYNKLKLLKGIYRIDHLGTIFIPTEFTLDMNGSTFKLHEFTGNSALMIDLNNTFDSHVINGTIEGDYFNHDYKNSPNNSEWVNGVSIGGESKYSSFENMIVKDITGYGSGNGIANSRDKKLGYTYLSPKGIVNTFKLGDIDRKTGLDIPSTNRTTCNFRDITGYAEIGYLSVSLYLGYQDNPCGTWNLICHFYDENKEYINSTDAYQYRRVAVPYNAMFMRVTILNEAYPTNLSIQLFRIPTHCSFKNIKHENCRCVGMAQAAMKDMLVENCEFTKCGQSSARCAYDAEDGWDMMQDCTFRDLNFHDNPLNDFLTCAGHNFVIDGQVAGKMYIWERTRSLVVKNCKNTNITLQSGGSDTIVRHGVYRVSNNEFNGGTVANNISKNSVCTGSLGGLVSDSTLGGIVNSSVYNNCIIKVNSDFLGYITKISMINCQLTPEVNFTDRYKISFNGGHLNGCYFANCKFYGKSSLSNHNGFYSGKFVGCFFEDTTIATNVLANADDAISFEDCTIGYNENNLIYYSPFAYSKGTFSKIEFNNCVINNTDNNLKPLIYAYAKPNGYCKFNNCTLSIPESIMIFDGYPTNVDYIESYTMEFNNSPLPSNIKMVSDYFKSSPNIKISIS